MSKIYTKNDLIMVFFLIIKVKNEGRIRTSGLGHDYCKYFMEDFLTKIIDNFLVLIFVKRSSLKDLQ